MAARGQPKIKTKNQKNLWLKPQKKLGGQRDLNPHAMEIGKRKGVVVTSKLMEARALTCAFSTKTLFRNLSFSISSSQIHHITGPNGSGKTTLLKCMAGLHSPALGQVIKQENCQFISCASWQSDDLTVQQTIGFWQDYYEQDFQPAVQIFDLEKLMAMKIKNLSQGQKQRLSLSRLINKKNNVWLLDEPTLSLDKKWVKFFYSKMQDHLQKGGAIAIVSHDKLPFKMTEINLGDCK